MPEPPESGLLDTSVVIDLERIDPTLLPRHVAICAVTLAELTAGPAATDDVAERARRQSRLQRVEATFEPLPFDTEAARAFGLVHAAALASGRQPRRRLADLQIAAVALAHDLALVTRHPDDFAGLDDLLVTIAV